MHAFPYTHARSTKGAAATFQRAQSESARTQRTRLTRCVQRRAAPSRALPPAPSRCHPLGRAAQAAASAGAAQRGVDLVAALQDVEQLALQEKRTCKGVSTAPG